MPYQLAAAGDQPTLGWCARGALPHLGQESCRQQLGKGLSVGLVGLLAALADPMDRLRVGQGYPSDPTAQDRGDRQGIAGRLQRDLVVGSQAVSELGKGGRRRLDPPGGPDLPMLEDRDLAEVAVHIQPDEPHPAPFLAARYERKRAKRHIRIRARSTLGQSQGRPDTTRGLAAHRNGRPALPPLSQAPVPEPVHATAQPPIRATAQPLSSCPYNYHRPHGALDGQTPYERLKQRTQARV